MNLNIQYLMPEGGSDWQLTFPVCKQGFICIPQFSLRRCRKDLNLSDVTDDTLVLRALRIFRLLRILHLCCTSCCHSVSNAGCPTHLNSTCICCKAITTAVMKGLRSFLWTVIFLLLLLYAVGVFITQSVTDFKISLRPWHLQVSLVVVVVVT